MFNWEKNLERTADALERISGVLERFDDFVEGFKNLAPVFDRIEDLEKYTPTIDVLIDWMREVTEGELRKHLCPTCALEEGCGTSHVATCNITKCEGYKPPAEEPLECWCGKEEAGVMGHFPGCPGGEPPAEEPPLHKKPNRYIYPKSNDCSAAHDVPVKDELVAVNDPRIYGEETYDHVDDVVGAEDVTVDCPNCGKADGLLINDTFYCKECHHAWPVVPNREG